MDDLKWLAIVLGLALLALLYVGLLAAGDEGSGS